MFDVADFLRQNAKDFTDVDDLYYAARELGLVSGRREFESILESGFNDPEVVAHIYTELPIRGHRIRIETPRGKRVGLIKWTDNPRFVGR